MEKETKYGMISDIHGDPRVIVPTMQVLLKEGAERFLVNGDIGGWQGDLEKSQNYTAFIINEVAKAGKETFIQPGSHEPLIVYGPVADHFSDKFSHVHNAIKTRQVEQSGHSLVFVPGSDFTCGGEYQIGNDENLPTGGYVNNGREGRGSLALFRNWDEYNIAMQMGGQTAFHYSNIQDLRKLVKNPDNTIVVCHVPRKFSGLETCVDMAEFGEAMEDFNLQGSDVKKNSVFPLPVAQKIVQAGYPVKIKKENRGNEGMKTLYEELGINKAVSGHFHESSHRANDSYGNHVEEGKPVRELFWNSGHLDAGNTGILTVKGGEVSYRNIRLQDYLS